MNGVEVFVPLKETWGLGSCGKKNKKLKEGRCGYRVWYKKLEFGVIIIVRMRSLGYPHENVWLRWDGQDKWKAGVVKARESRMMERLSTCVSWLFLSAQNKGTGEWLK